MKNIRYHYYKECVMCKKKKIRPYRNPLRFPETPICKSCANDPTIYSKFEKLYVDPERSHKLSPERHFIDDTGLK